MHKCRLAELGGDHLASPIWVAKKCPSSILGLLLSMSFTQTECTEVGIVK